MLRTGGNFDLEVEATGGVCSEGMAAWRPELANGLPSASVEEKRVGRRSDRVAVLNADNILRDHTRKC